MNVYAAIWAVLTELDNISKLKEVQRTTPKELEEVLLLNPLMALALDLPLIYHD